MKRRFRKYRRKLRKKFLILSEKILRRFYTISRPLVSHGNKVSLVNAGEEALETLLYLIEHAKEYILLEYYIFRDDNYGSLISEALIKKSQKGVKVYLIYDFIGSFDVKNNFFERMIMNGISVTSFNPIKLFSNPFKWDRRDHRKLAIFDGEKAIVSGWNIGEEYLSGREDAMRDVGVMVEGPVVRQLERLFIKVYEEQNRQKIKLKKHGGVKKSGDDEVWVIESSPNMSFKPIYNAYRLAIMTAKKSIWIANAYFVPNKKLRKALKNAVKRLVDVKIVLPDKIDVPLVKYASYNFFESFLAAGIRIYERAKMMLHSKVAVIDDVWVTVGSTNLHRRSFEKNYELNLVVISERFGKEIKALFEEDLKFSRAIQIQDWVKRPFKERIKEKIASIFSIFL